MVNKQSSNATKGEHGSESFSSMELPLLVTVPGTRSVDEHSLYSMSDLTSRHYPACLAAYLQSLVLCCAVGFLTAIIYYSRVARAAKDFNGQPASEPGIVILTLEIPMVWAYTLERIMLCLPWIMGRTFRVEREEDLPKTTKQWLYSWLTLSPTSDRSAIGVLILIYIVSDVLVNTLYHGAMILSPSLFQSEFDKSFNAYVLIANVLHYTVIVPYIYTSRFSVSRVANDNQCVEMSKIWYKRIMGIPYSYFGLCCFATLWILQALYVSRRWEAEEYLVVHMVIIPCVVCVCQFVTLVLEYLNTNSQMYVNHPAYLMGLSFWYQYVPVSIGKLFIFWLAPVYQNRSAGTLDKLSVYIGFFSSLVAVQYVVRFIAARAVSPRLALLFVFAIQVFEDAISDLAFLELDPFTAIFFITSVCHVIKTIIRDLDILATFALKVKRSIMSHWRRLYVDSRDAHSHSMEQQADLQDRLSDSTVLYHWHQQYDRFFLRHQNFISEISCKVIVMTLLCMDYGLAEYAAGSRWTPTLTPCYTNQQRTSLILEVLYLTAVVVITHVLILSLLRKLEQKEEKNRQEVHRMQSLSPQPPVDDSAQPQPPQTSSLFNYDNIMSLDQAGVISLHEKETLRWLAHDSWSSLSVRVLLICPIAYFGAAAFRAASLAVSGGRIETDWESSGCL